MNRAERRAAKQRPHEWVNKSGGYGWVCINCGQARPERPDPETPAEATLSPATESHYPQGGPS